MNATLEQRLIELTEEAAQLGAPAVHTVLNLLLAAHNNGDHHNFAKYCCQFSPCVIDLKVQAADESSKSAIEFDDDSWDWDLGQ